MSKSHAGAVALVFALTIAACHTAPAARPEPRLTGIGLVVGLDHTGATTPEATKAVLEALRDLGGPQLSPTDIVPGSMAVVRTTCALPATVTVGQATDVRCEAIDAGVSLRGGELMRAELRDDDGVAYAVAAGAIMVASPGTLPADAPRPPANRGFVCNGALFVRGR